MTYSQRYIKRYRGVDKEQEYQPKQTRLWTVHRIKREADVSRGRRDSHNAYRERIRRAREEQKLIGTGVYKRLYHSIVECLNLTSQ